MIEIQKELRPLKKKNFAVQKILQTCPKQTLKRWFYYWIFILFLVLLVDKDGKTYAITTTERQEKELENG